MTPASLSAIAALMKPVNIFLLGSSFTEVMRPKLPRDLSPFGGTPSMSDAFQKMSEQCSLNAAIAHIICPL